MNILLLAQIVAPIIISKPLPGVKEIRDTSVNYIILHTDEGGGYAGARRTLIKKKNSYHFYIQRDGKIIKLLDPKYKANHAGISYFKGHFRMNNYSIAICLDNKPPQKFTQKQYESTAKLINYLQKRYRGPTSKIIVGHSDIAIPRGRKKDPGEQFNWNKLWDYMILLK